MSEAGIQRDEMREYMQQLPLRKESHANFENILENHRTRWRVFKIYIFNKDKTEVVYKN